MKSALAVAVLSLVLLSSPAFAQPTTAPVASQPATKPLTENQILAAQLADADPAVQKAAWEKVQSLMSAPIEMDAQGRPKPMLDPLWARALARAKKFDEAEQVAMAGITKRPYDAVAVSAFAKARTQAFIAAKKFEAALAAAKSAYNVSALNDAAAIDQLITPLTKVKPDTTKATTDEFKAQNTKDSAVQPKADLLKPIVADIKAYEGLLASINATDFSTHMARGNLLLLCDRPGEAKASFEAALDHAKVEREAMAAFDGVARCVRAETGGVAPANAWLAEQMKNKPAD